MIKKCVKKLINNLPNELKNNKSPMVIDLVLEGGLFNGSYIIGSLYFLKEMEKLNYIKIDRISGCSIGSIAGFLYFIDRLDLTPMLYKVIYNNFKKNSNLKILKNLKQMLSSYIPNNICEIVNNKLFICYNNIKKQKKYVKCKYNDVDDIINTILYSSHMPYLIDGNILCKNKNVDGFFPYIFKIKPNKKILYLNLISLDKMYGLISLKNEKNNFHRILYGLLDIHHFFIKKTNTQMCSYVNNWSYYNILINKIKLIYEYMWVNIIYYYVCLNNILPNDLKQSMICKMLQKIIKTSFTIILKNYCF